MEQLRIRIWRIYNKEEQKKQKKKPFERIHASDVPNMLMVAAGAIDPETHKLHTETVVQVAEVDQINGMVANLIMPLLDFAEVLTGNRDAAEGVVQLINQHPPIDWKR